MEKFQTILNEVFVKNIQNYIEWLKSDTFNVLILCLDLLIVIYLAKKAYNIIKDTNAIQLLKGIFILIAVTLISGWLDLYILNFLLKSIMTYGVLLIIVIFQPEIRRALGDIGNQRFRKLFKIQKEETLNDKIINNIVESCNFLSRKNIGALIILERDTNLGDYEKTGIKIDGELSQELIINIFEPNTPLHDGAVVVRGEKIKSAACILPLTKRTDLKSEFGTRHRAGIGISELTDCISVIVSEETGKISLAMNGKISTNLDSEQLNKFLRRELLKEIEN